MNVPVLIEPVALQELRETHPVVIIDTRDASAYADEHIPGAVNLRDIFTFLIDDSRPETLRRMQTTFADALGRAGLSGREVAVVYEDALDSGYGQSCRGYFLLRYLGYPQVAILHGGYRAWKEAGLPVTDEMPRPTPRVFPVDVRERVFVAKQEMLGAVDDPRIIKLDVRDRDEWQGTSSSPYGVDFCPRKGRIPGAVWLEWYRVLDRSGDAPRFRSRDQLLATCREVGIRPDDTIYVYCFKGSRAALVMVALTLAGFREVRNYFASWNEWSRDLALPIETGAPRAPTGFTALGA
ncbi:MAG TPA: sulfurtransferase [Haliangium sp.]|nr:sulfurtransferase [Haliangium sp.]